MKKINTDFECVVVGAGVIGLSIARSFSNRGVNVLVLEKNAKFGEETSSRNSGVIHAGIYYPNYSLKSLFCKKGNIELYKYAKERKIKVNKCQKLIVSCSKSDEVILKKIQKIGKLNGVELFQKTNSDLKKMEPNLDCNSALLSKNSGIIDVHNLMLNFISDIEKKKSQIVFNSKVDKVDATKEKIFFSVDSKKLFSTKFFINCSGLFSHILAKKIIGLNKKLIPKIKYIKGNYMKLSGNSPFNRLIYPTPTKFGLGIHSTLNLNGQTIFGPDDEKITKIDYNVSERKKKKFVDSIKKFWPNIINKNITPDYSGIRTKTENNDFVIQDYTEHKVPGLVNLFGIDSPGLTSSIPIGEYVSSKCINYLR